MSELGFLGLGVGWLRADIKNLYFKGFGVRDVKQGSGTWKPQKPYYTGNKSTLFEVGCLEGNLEPTKRRKSARPH